MDADPEAFEQLFPLAAGFADATSPAFEAELRKTSQLEDEQVKDALAERQARARWPCSGWGTPMSSGRS